MSRKLCCKNNEKNNFVLFLEQKFREILQLKNSMNFVKSELKTAVPSSRSCITPIKYFAFAPIGELSVHDLVTLEILSQIKVHQSGINSVISNFHENLIISGGDDGSISISNR